MQQLTTAVVKPAAPLRDDELRALLSGVAARDKAAFRAIYHALRPALVRHLHRLLRGADQVDELVNDVMWVVWQNAADFRGDAQVTTWVLGIATLKSHRVRHRQLRERELLDHSRLALVADPPSDVDRDLEDGLAQLSTEHRDALELTYYFGYSCAEVAALRGCPVGTVKTRLHYARRRLKQVLEHYVGYGEAS
jgi:RNA polymerase sigma-70 factor (ECF subfamily)